MPDMRWFPSSVCRPSVVRPVVTSRKPSKTDPQLLWNIIDIGIADSVARPDAPWGIF